VEVRYRGTLINGKEFGSSGTETRTFKLAQIVAGLREALQLMPAGYKWQIVIPPQLAYGERSIAQTVCNFRFISWLGTHLRPPRTP
jgi:FKBP-type peptidyl-prolyl cis-trans isomerase